MDCLPLPLQLSRVCRKKDKRKQNCRMFVWFKRCDWIPVMISMMEIPMYVHSKTLSLLFAGVIFTFSIRHFSVRHTYSKSRPSHTQNTLEAEANLVEKNIKKQKERKKKKKRLHVEIYTHTHAHSLILSLTRIDKRNFDFCTL